MKVLVLYDSIDSVSAYGHLPEDFGAEYDDENAISGIVDALILGGHSAEALQLDAGFALQILDLCPDAVFNIAEGVRGRGRESLVPAWLDHLDMPYTGSDAVALGVSLDKALSKQIAASSGIRTPAFKVVETVEELRDLELDFPLFVKPVAEGSSMGIRENSLVNTRNELREAAQWVMSQYRQGCLIEEFAPGREFCVGILGNRNPEVFPVVEVESTGRFYSYEQKSRHQKKLICPADIPDDMEQEMVKMALNVFSLLGCRDLARVDFKLDHRDRPAFLEINPLPGLARDYSIFPYQALAHGMDYNDLINRIVELAVMRGANENEK